MAKKDDHVRRLEHEAEYVKKLIENFKKELESMKKVISQKEDEVIITLDKMAQSETDKNVNITKLII